MLVCKFVLETFINVTYFTFNLGLLYIASYKHNLEFAPKCLCQELAVVSIGL